MILISPVAFRSNSTALSCEKHLYVLINSNVIPVFSGVPSNALPDATFITFVVQLMSPQCETFKRRESDQTFHYLVW